MVYNFEAKTLLQSSTRSEELYQDLGRALSGEADTLLDIHNSSDHTKSH